MGEPVWLGYAAGCGVSRARRVELGVRVESGCGESRRGAPSGALCASVDGASGAGRVAVVMGRGGVELWSSWRVSFCFERRDLYSPGGPSVLCRHPHHVSRSAHQRCALRSEVGL